MQTQSLHKDSHGGLGDVTPPQNTPKPLLQEIHPLRIAFQAAAESDLASELIEMRYQEHLAREDLQALFDAGTLCGP